VDLGLGWELKLGPRRALSLSADLLNATDRKGLYNFLSTFGGTHVLPPRTLALRARLTF
jgi:outer membrane receptor protein involved in Fe transport